MSFSRARLMMELVCKNTIIDEVTLEPLASVVVGVCPEEGQQFTPLRVILQVDNNDAWGQQHDLARRREIMASVVHNDALDIKKRFFSEGRAHDLEIAIALHRKAVEITPQTHRTYALVMTNLANAIEARYDHNRHLADLELAIALRRTLISVWKPPSHTVEAAHLSDLADNLEKHYNVSREADSLDEAIALRKEIIESTPPGLDHVDGLRILSRVFKVRFQHKRDPSDLDEAISLQRTVYSLACSDEDIDRTGCLQDLADSLYMRFRHSMRMDDMEELIDLNQKLLGREPGTYFDKESTLSLLSLLLHQRFRQSGNPDDLERSTSLQLQVLSMRVAPDPRRLDALVNLSSLLYSRFELEGDKKSLDDAASFLQEASHMTPLLHEQRPRVLNNLSIILRQRFEETNHYNDILDAIDLSREALKLEAPSKESRISILSNLAAALWSRYEPSTGTIADLDEIISLNEDALKQASRDNGHHTTILANLGNVFRGRFDKTHDKEDLKRAISALRKCLQVTDPTVPSSGSGVWSLNLGLAFCQMYGLTGELDHLNEAITAFRFATSHPNGPPSMKFIAARSWAEHADRYKHASAFEAYRLAIGLLPVIVAINADLETRQQKVMSNMTRVDGLAVQAAGCAIEVGNLEEAVELLEAGRSMFWSQGMKLRSPLGELEALHPKQAEKLRDIRRQLETGSFGSPKLESLASNERRVADSHQISVHSRQLNDEWNTTLDEIHKLPGFESFLQPRPFSALQKSSEKGPVVIFCVTRVAGHALIITGDGIKHLLFEDFNSKTVSILVNALDSITSSDTRSSRPDAAKSKISEQASRDVAALQDMLETPDRYSKKHPLGRKPVSSSEDVLSLVLKTLWIRLMEPLIRFLDLKKTLNPPKIYWYPTGPLTFLPIHAAGIYDSSPTSVESVHDYVVSSYIPTIDTLLLDEVRTSQDLVACKILAISQPQTLPNALAEVREIENILKSTTSCSITLLGNKTGNPATVAAVLEQLSSSSVVHFACHGKQYAGKPLDSALILEDGQLTLPMIMEVQMKYAQLAFLSACETARGEREVPDESLHLGAALLFSGFQGVVATMWSIADIDGPKVSRDFYGHLIEDTKARENQNELGLDTSQAAQALHCAILKLREANVPLRRWVPFIYLGL